MPIICCENIVDKVDHHFPIAVDQPCHRHSLKRMTMATRSKVNRRLLIQASSGRVSRWVTNENITGQEKLIGPFLPFFPFSFFFRSAGMPRCVGKFAFIDGIWQCDSIDFHCHCPVYRGTKNCSPLALQSSQEGGEGAGRRSYVTIPLQGYCFVDCIVDCWCWFDHSRTQPSHWKEEDVGLCYCSRQPLSSSTNVANHGGILPFLLSSLFRRGTQIKGNASYYCFHHPSIDPTAQLLCLFLFGVQVWQSAE